MESRTESDARGELLSVLGLPAHRIEGAEEIPPECLNGSPEEIAIKLDYLTKGHVKRMRYHILALGPILHYVRESEVWRDHPEGFQSMDEWARQREIDFAHGVYTDIINIWKYVLPQCREAGLSNDQVLEVEFSKLRHLVKPFREAQELGQPMPEPEIHHLMLDVAPNSTWEQLRQYLKNPVGHDDEPEFEWVFTVRRKGDELFEIRALFDRDQMKALEKRLRPTWVGPDGNVLHFTEPAA